MLGNPSHHLRARAQLPLTHGGLGLRSAFSTRHTAYSASWADTLPALHRRSPGVTSRILHLLQGEARSRPPSILEANQAAHILRDAGFAVPAWDTLPTSGPPNPHAREAGEYQRGWQRLASSAADSNASAALLSDLDPPSRALLLSQAGPYASRAFTVCPTSPEVTLSSEHFRVLLRRRVRLPLPFTDATCRCGGPLDEFGDHRSACPTAGFLRTRALPP